MAFSPDHAKRMRKALDGSGRVIQVGIQMISGPGMTMVREFTTPERMGVITAPGLGLGMSEFEARPNRSRRFRLRR